MSGQSASLSISEAKAMQNRICEGSMHQGPANSTAKMDKTTMKKETSHQGK